MVVVFGFSIFVSRIHYVQMFSVRLCCMCICLGPLKIPICHYFRLGYMIKNFIFYTVCVTITIEAT